MMNYSIFADMKTKAFLFLMISNFALAQSFEVFYPNTENMYFVDVSKNDQDYKMKFQFNNYENKFYVMNRLLFDNKTAKSLLYIKFLNIYAVSNRRQVNFYGFGELFPKKGFYKTGNTKNFLGEKAEEYNFDSDISPIKLWFADGTQAENEMYGYLKDLNVLQNIHKNKKLVGVSLHDIIFDNSTAGKKEKSFMKSSLENFIWNGGNSEYSKCMKNFEENRKLDLALVSIPKEKKFTYEISEKYTGKEFTREYSGFSDDTRTTFIRSFTDKKTNENKAYYYDQPNNSVLTGSLKEGTFYYTGAYRFNDECKGSDYKKIEENEDHILILRYPTTGKYELVVYEIQKKNAPKFFYDDLKATGFLKSIKSLNSHLDEYSSTADVKKSNTQIIFEKK